MHTPPAELPALPESERLAVCYICKKPLAYLQPRAVLRVEETGRALECHTACAEALAASLAGTVVL